MKLSSSSLATNSPVYIHKIDHRNGAPKKSQWTISTHDEESCFVKMYSTNWHDGCCGWGLYFNNGIVNYLGKGVKRNHNLFIAKFIDSSKVNIWHGYPADHNVNNQDTPPEELLEDWKKQGYLKLKKIRKIMRGQPCSL